MILNGIQVQSDIGFHLAPLRLFVDRRPPRLYNKDWRDSVSPSLANTLPSNTTLACRTANLVSSNNGLTMSRSTFKNKSLWFESVECQ